MQIKGILANPQIFDLKILYFFIEKIQLTMYNV